MAFEDPNKPFRARSIETVDNGDGSIFIEGNDIDFRTGHPSETLPGSIAADDGGGGTTLSVRFQSPEVAGFPFKHSNLSMETQTSGATAFDVDADQMHFFGQFFQVGAPSIKLGDATPDLDLVIESDGTHAVIKNEDQVWKGTAVTPLAGTWVDTAGSRFGYYKDATGRVQLRGRVSGGGAGATVVTLPAAYRPTSNLDFTMRGGTTVCAVSVSTLGVVTVSANLATASASGINLDVVSFPTF